jgi:ribonuclease R
MLDVFKDKILSLLKRRDYQPIKPKQFAKALGVEQQDYAEFKKAFDELREAGQVVIGSGNAVQLPAMTSKITGRFRANPKGFGFIIPLQSNANGDLFVPASNTAGAMTGDIVEASAVRQGMRDGKIRYTGRVTNILERANDRFVGTLMKGEAGWYVQPDGNGFTEQITVDDVTAKGAKAKDKVVVEILSYPSERHLARGVILKVLGRAGQYEAEIASVIEQFRLPGEFEQDCISQAKKAAENFKPDLATEILSHRGHREHREKEYDRISSDAGREDITGKIVITIDPADAKDFDDAISIERDANGNRLLGVHIADVSSFVTTGSALDVEGKERGNSTYLPGRVIPMLPEVLSNGICSLQPGQKRYCKSAYIGYDDDGKVISRRYANSVMCSAARLTYTDADRILKGHTKDFSAEVVTLIKEMETLAKIIEARREKAGMLHLDLPETELIYDDAGRVVDAEPADTSYPHTIIEMFMVEANEAVASLIDRLKIPFLRRIHPEPNELGLKELGRLLKTVGLSLPSKAGRAEIQNVLDAVRGRDAEYAVNMFVLRSFEKAEYSPMDMGHYALASRQYCHFTSPIRRYADLTVHRILDGYLHGDEEVKVTKGELAEIGKHITFTEERAEDAERELKTVLLLQMLSGRIGDEMDTVVTGVTSFGVFVRCRKFGVEGLIPLEQLGPDEWRFNQKAYCVTGAGSGYTIGLGQKMRVRIVSVNVPARQLNLEPAKPLVEKPRPRKSKAKKQFPRKKRGSKRRR